MSLEAKWKNRASRYQKEGEQAKKGWYIWRINPEDMRRTRPDHLRLNGMKFRWDDPPVVDTKTGAKGHPGTDKHCRCWAEEVKSSSD